MFWPKQLILLFIFLLIGVVTQAYTLLADKATINDTDLNEIDYFFIRAGYDIYKNRDDLNFMPGVDRLYTKNKNKEKVFLKTSVFIKDKNSTDLFKFKNGFLSNVKIKSKVSVIYFSGQSEEKIKLIKTQIRQALQMKSVYMKVFLGEAYANGEACDRSQLEKFKFDIAGQHGLVRGVIQCTKGLGFGVWNATGGTVVDLAKIGYAAAKYVSETPQRNVVTALQFMGMAWCHIPGDVTQQWCNEWQDELFSSAEESFNQMQSMILSFYGTVRYLVPNFGKLDADKQTELLCETISTIGVSTAISMATAGAGAPSMILKVRDVLDKIAKASKIKVPPVIVAEINSLQEYLGKAFATFNKVSPEKAIALQEAFLAYEAQTSKMLRAFEHYNNLKRELHAFNELAKQIKKNPSIIPTLTNEQRALLAKFISQSENQKMRDNLNKAHKEYVHQKILAQRQLARIKPLLTEAENLVASSRLADAEKVAFKRTYSALLSCALIEDFHDASIENSKEIKPTDTDGRTI